MNFELQFREKKLQVRLIQKQKKHFLDLLLLGDEQEEMVDRYLDRGDLWVVFGAQRAVAVAVVITREDGACELKNMAVEPSFQNQGLGSLLLNYLCEQYRRNCHTMYVGTGETVKTMHFYEKNNHRLQIEAEIHADFTQTVHSTRRSSPAPLRANLSYRRSVSSSGLPSAVPSQPSIG